jgi:hypothetical protein
MTDLSIKHILLFSTIVILLYYLTSNCSCRRNGFSVGIEKIHKCPAWPDGGCSFDNCENCAQPNSYCGESEKKCSKCSKPTAPSIWCVRDPPSPPKPKPKPKPPKPCKNPWSCDESHPCCKGHKCIGTAIGSKSIKECVPDKDEEPK